MAHDPAHPDLQEAAPGQTSHQGHRRYAYPLFALNLLLSFLAMYVLMFTMVDTWEDFYNNLNMAFMALTMLAPMGALMLAIMSDMYPNRWLNLVLYVGLALVFILALAGIRTQAQIGNEQFIASMIPHHSGAILMCREANITDAELRSLCAGIESGQRQEIEQMKEILLRLRGSQG